MAYQIWVLYSELDHNLPFLRKTNPGVVKTRPIPSQQVSDIVKSKNLVWHVCR